MKVNQVLSLGRGNRISWWVVNIFVFWETCSGLSVVFELVVKVKSCFVTLWKIYTCSRILSCTDTNLQVIFINTTLPFESWKSLPEIDLWSSRVAERPLKHMTGLCGIFEKLLYVMFIFVIKLKLASGNAYNCSDRSGTNSKEKDVFFKPYFVLKATDWSICRCDKRPVDD